MTNYLKNKFALSEQGAKDLHKAIWSCTATDISLMFPVGILYLLLKELCLPLFNGGSMELNLWMYVGLSVLALGILFVLEYIQYNSTFLASYSESANQRISLAELLRKLPLSFFGKRDLSDLTTTIMSDCAMVETAFSHYIPELIGAVLSLIPVGIGLFVIDWSMALALLWVIPVAFFIVFATKKLQDGFGRRTKAKKLAYVDGIQEYIENIKDIKASNQNRSYLRNLEEKLAVFEKVSIKGELITGISVTSAQMFLKIGIATTVLAGSIFLAKGSIDFLTFLIFLIAASRVYEPLAASLQNLAAVFSTLLTVERMREIRNQPIQEGSEQTEYKGYDIVFEHVGFSYHRGETVLEDVSFTAKQGEVTAIVGPSGGGKSTAVKLTARFWDIQKGKITLGGTDISTVDPETYLKNFSIVFQDVVLFNNTVMENIRLGKLNATDEEVLAAAKAAQCDEFVSKMPKGYQTMIGENGSALSGGERQRISIARALLKNAPVILLDEATASLDVENESLVQSAISELIKNKTVLIIAHRMRTVAGADKIVVLSEGHVAEQGTPKELMKQEGIYRHMVELQTESQNWALNG